MSISILEPGVGRIRDPLALGSKHEKRILHNYTAFYHTIQAGEHSKLFLLDM